MSAVDFEYCKKEAIAFGEWLGTNYKQDEGSVVGNVYYERGVFNKKDYCIEELYNEFIKSRQ